jgi:hypothetical protein
LKTINLTVPFFSQRDNNYIWHYKREKDEEIKKKTLKKGSPVTDSAGNEITTKIWDGCCNITCLAMVLNYLGVTQDTPLWEKDYTTENDFILEQDITINKDEIETEIEFNFDIEKVLDESETELRVIPKLILEDIELYQHKINNLFLKLGGRLL